MYPGFIRNFVNNLDPVSIVSVTVEKTKFYSKLYLGFPENFVVNLDPGLNATVTID